MALFRARLRLEGPIVSTLASGMIFGQLCWALREREGEAALVDWLARPDELWGVSDAFPAGCLPRPLLRSTTGGFSAPEAATPDRMAVANEKASERKRLNKKPLMSRAAFLSARSDLGERSLGKDDLSDAADKRRRKARNSVDRHTGRARDDGGLYFIEEVWTREGAAERDLYVEAPAGGRDRVSALLAWVGENGFGKSASLGRGRFSLSEVVEDAELAHLPGATRQLSLSRGTRTASMAEVLCRIEPYFGKAGPQLTVGEGASPFKRPILLTRPGSTFARAGEGRFGEWLTGVHPTRPEIGHNAFHIAIPFMEAPDA